MHAPRTVARPRLLVHRGRVAPSVSAHALAHRLRIPEDELQLAPREAAVVRRLHHDVYIAGVLMAIDPALAEGEEATSCVDEGRDPERVVAALPRPEELGEHVASLLRTTAGGDWWSPPPAPTAPCRLGQRRTCFFIALLCFVALAVHLLRALVAASALLHLAVLLQSPLCPIVIIITVIVISIILRERVFLTSLLLTSNALERERLLCALLVALVYRPALLQLTVLLQRLLCPILTFLFLLLLLILILLLIWGHFLPIFFLLTSHVLGRTRQILQAVACLRLELPL
mmetsp:Transcript_852/g.1967  ORF Transcript_852/g.1967 Transcript_852/m.1967 type:complete len:287 (+) Transcript_852:1125-1985(+)